jgi:hypothetical protein
VRVDQAHGAVAEVAHEQDGPCRGARHRRRAGERQQREREGESSVHERGWCHDAAVGYGNWGISPIAARPPDPCTWGGTPAAPTGTFTIKPGLTNIPSAGPLQFNVTGRLSGGAGCGGRFSFDGQVDAGSTCSFNVLEGVARGLPGVARFAGHGVGPFGPSLLYDAAGQVVGSEDADVATQANAPRFTDCGTPAGFTGGTFSSVIELLR